MKKSACIIATFFAIHCSFSQMLDAGIMGAVNTTWLLNSNVFDQGDNQDVDFTITGTYGANIGYYFTPGVGVEVDLLLGKFAQNYVGAEAGKSSYQSRTTMDVMHIPVFLKLGSGAYAELGVEYTIVNGVNYHAEISSVDSAFLYNFREGYVDKSTENVKTSFSGNYLSAVLGLGGYIELKEWLLLNTGLRFSYGFTDLGGVDGFGNNLTEKENNKLYGRSASNNTNSIYTSYSPTNPAYAHFHLGLTYRLFTSKR